MAEFRIVVVVDASRARRGVRSVTRGLQNVNREAGRTNTLLRRAFAFAGVFIGIRALTSLGDTAIEVRNRIRIVTSSEQELNDTLKKLAGIARETRQPLSSLTTLFQRGSIAADELGKSNEELLEFTRRVGLGLVIQGTSAEVSRGALIQLSQALGAGIVRAEEFNAILEGAFPIAQAAARGLDAAGNSVAKLRRLVIDGKVSSEEFFDAFIKGSEDFEATAEGLIPTFSQAFQILRDKFSLFLDDVNRSTGILGILSGAIVFLADNLVTVLKVTVALGAALAFPFIQAGIAGMVAMTGATTGLSAALVIATRAAKLLLRALLIGFAIEGVTLIVKGILEIIKVLETTPTTFGQIARVAADNFVNGLIGGFVALGRGLINVIRVITDPLTAAFIEFGSSIPDLLFGDLSFSDVTDRVAESVAKSFSDALSRVGSDFVQDLNTRFINIASDEDIASVAAGFATVRGTAPEPQAADPNRKADKALELTKKQITALRTLRDALDPVGAAQRELTEGQDLLVAALQAGNITVQERAELLVLLNRSLRDQLDPLAAVNREIEEERTLLNLNSREREVQTVLLERVEELRKAGIVLNDLEKVALEENTRALERQNRESERRDALLQDIRGPQQDFIGDQKALNQLFVRGAINADEFDDKLRQIQLTFLDSQTDAASGFERALLRLGEQSEDTAAVVEDALVNAFKSAEDAMVDFVTKGKFEFTGLIDSIFADLTRLAVKGAIISPIAKALEGSSGSGGILGGLFSGGGGSFLSSLFGGGGVSGASGGFGGLSGLIPGLQEGGLLQVGGSAGADRNLLSINNRPVARVSRGETIAIAPSTGQRPLTIINQISAPDGSVSRRTQQRIAARTISAMQQADRRNN